MSKYVYLFELDSVRKTDEEIVKAQQTLYDEIVVNGNTVVMTYNQVVDSRGFFCLLDNREYYDNIIELFKKGKIKISQYRDIRTLSQYLLNSIERENGFIYSALPVKNNQKRLLALIRRSLIYSDLSEIHGYETNGHRTEEELCDLFIELNEIKISDETKYIEQDSELSTKEMREILNNLYWMLSYILELSPMHDIYLSPKDENEYQNLKMSDFIKIVLNLPISHELWDGAKAIIENLRNNKIKSNKRNDRSEYLIELKKQWISLEHKNLPIECYKFAESIINQCYNYACEISICNISKHYDSDELMNGTNEKPSFQADFLLRLQEDWRDGDPMNRRYLTEETNSFVNFENWSSIPSFKRAARITGYRKETTGQNLNEVYKYEYNMKQQQNENRRRIRAGLRKKILFLFGYFFIIVVYNVSLDYFLGQFIDSIIASQILSSLITLFLMLPTEFLSSWLQKRNPHIMSLSESIGGIVVVLKDRLSTVQFHSVLHTNKYNRRIEETETVSKYVPIDFVKTDEIKRYINMRKECGGSDCSLFRDSNIYSLYNVDDDSIVKMILRNEEIYNRKYGIIYQSKYNKLLVDPVENEGECIPYERMTPASGHDGVVIVAKHQDKYILLNQFRHALRQKQYSFPRGFAESSNPKDDVIREIKEELHAKIIGEPRELGKIAPDSGLQTTRANVYCVDIDSYNTNEGHEGIINSIEISSDDFEQWIKDNKIDDGYTLGAFMLLKTKMNVAVG